MDYAELRLIQLSLTALRQRVNSELDALESQVGRLLPEDVGRLKVPSGYTARRKFYKKYLATAGVERKRGKK